MRDRPVIVAAYDVHLARKREKRLTGPLAGLHTTFNTRVASATADASETCLQDFGNRLRRTILLSTLEAVTP